MENRNIGGYIGMVINFDRMYIVFYKNIRKKYIFDEKKYMTKRWANNDQNFHLNDAARKNCYFFVTNLQVKNNRNN